MKKLIASITELLGLGASEASESGSTLDYDRMVLLDAEDLAEAGIKGAYEELKPILRTYVAEPAELVEITEDSQPSYSVSCSGVTYDIYSPALPDSEGESWARATYAFFTIINHQLKESVVKFYAINGGNDLGGMFLTE